MTGFGQVPFDATEFVDNPEPRCPCLLLLDTSMSMRGERMRQLNEGLQTFRQQLNADSLAAKRVEVGIVTFGPVRVESEFTSAEHWVPPHLDANGATPMGEAIVTGLDLVDQRKQVYREQGISYYRPWLFLITDGGPTDRWDEAARRVKAAESAKAGGLYAVGVEDADMDTLAKIAVREPLQLRGLDFGGLFTWLSNSMAAVSHSQVTEEVPLVNPTGPSGWATA